MHWPNRYRAAAVRLQHRTPEDDTPSDHLAEGIALIHMGLSAIVSSQLTRSATDARNQLNGELGKVGLGFVAMCEAYTLDAEEVIEDAVQKYEAQKTPVVTIPLTSTSAPTAKELNPNMPKAGDGKSRQFTL